MDHEEHNEQTPPEQVTCNMCGIAKEPDAEGWDGDTCPACSHSVSLIARMNPGMMIAMPKPGMIF